MRKKLLCTFTIIFVLFLALQTMVYAAEGLEGGETTNTSPTISITNPTADLTYESNGEIIISGTVSDSDNNDVTVSAAIDGKQEIDTVAGGNGSWTLTWNIDSLNISEGTYTNITFTADDGNGGTNTADYTGNLTVDKSAPTVTYANISISGGSGTEGAFKIDDTLTATDNAGNTATTADTTNAVIENEKITEGDKPIVFPDNNLKQALINKDGLDSNGDEEISINEAKTLNSLVLNKKDIRDLTGLEYFTSLNRLDLFDNNISNTSSLSGLTALTWLSLGANNISDVEPLSGLTALTYLQLNSNQLSDIKPLSELTQLTKLYLNKNDIKDISPLMKLTSLEELLLDYNWNIYTSGTDNAVHLGDIKVKRINAEGNEIKGVWVPAGFVTDSSGMTAAELNSASISLELYPTTFVDNTLDKGNFILENAPSGLTISSVEYIDNKHVKLYLAYDGIGLNSNIDNLKIVIKKDELTDDIPDLIFKDDVPEIIAGPKDNWADVIKNEVVSDLDDYEIVGNVYTIKTAKGLAWVAEQVNNDSNDFLFTTVVLDSDIDLSAHFWTPIGVDGKCFKGSFDGKGHRITGLCIGTSDEKDSNLDYVGLFGNLEGATIQNVGIENCDIYSSKEKAEIGGLVGHASAIDPYSNCIIVNCYVTGNITGGDNAKVGGLVGFNDSGKVLNCYTTGNVTGGWSAYVGGLAGSVNFNGEVTNCYATGDVTGSYGALAGGLVGENNTTIKYGYWNSSATQTVGDNKDNKYGDCDGGLMDTKKTSAEMKVNAFAQSLNKNQSDSYGITLAEWGRDGSKNNGYPVLVGIGDGIGVSSAGTGEVTVTDASLSNLKVDNKTVESFDSATTTYDLGVIAKSSITIEATPTDTNATVTGDTGTQTLSYGLNTFTITVKAEDGTTKNYTINVTKGYQLTYTAGTGGSIQGTTMQIVAPNGDGTQVAAVPENGYRFVKWSDDKTTATRTDTNITSDISLTAEFGALDGDNTISSNEFIVDNVNNKLFAQIDSGVTTYAEFKAKVIIPPNASMKVFSSVYDINDVNDFDTQSCKTDSDKLYESDKVYVKSQNGALRGYTFDYFFKADYPKVEYTRPTEIEFECDAKKGDKVYWQVLTTNEAAPSAEELKARADGIGEPTHLIEDEGYSSVRKKGLNPETDYVAYFALERNGILSKVHPVSARTGEDPFKLVSSDSSKIVVDLHMKTISTVNGSDENINEMTAGRLKQLIKPADKHAEFYIMKNATELNEENVLKDENKLEAGNVVIVFGGESDDYRVYSIIFTASDTTAPTVTSVSPAKAAKNVAVNTNLEITFDENIQKGTGNITIFKASDNSVAESISASSDKVSVSGVKAIINPNNNLENGREYYVQIQNGCFVDKAGNAYSGISDSTTWSFTTLSNSNNNGGSSSGGNSGHSNKHSSEKKDTIKADTSDGSFDVGEKKTKYKNGQKETTVEVDTKAIEKQTKKMKEKDKVTVPITGNTDVAKVQFNVQDVKNMQKKELVLEVKTDNAAYELPTTQVDIKAISKEIGEDVELSDIPFTVSISKTSKDMAKVVESSTEDNGLAVVVPPVDFEIKATYKNKTYKVSKFNSFVKRMIEIPKGTDMSKITTAIVTEKDGSSRHIPTYVTVVDGKHYAVINALTNSTYSLIYNKTTFSDVADSHWGKKDIEKMASRLIVEGKGDGTFNPSEAITRAEMAKILVKALGLKPEEIDKFTDVERNTKTAGYIGTAYSYGIIKGTNETTFNPMGFITRQDAMTMIYRAGEIADFKDKDKSIDMSRYTDYVNVSDYAQKSVIWNVNNGIIHGKSETTLMPFDNITRAEISTIVNRFLVNAELIEDKK